MQRKPEKKVLILDDDPDFSLVLQKRFEAEGYFVVTGSDGLQGLMKVRKGNPDLIILDVLMPNLDGTQFFKILKGSKEYAGIPIMVITGKSALREEFIKLGCDYFATKPPDMNMVLQAARDLTKKKILIMGDYQDFQNHVKAAFPDDQNKCVIVPDITGMLFELARDFYHMVIVRLAQVDEHPNHFVYRVQDISVNPKIVIFVYSDAYVKGLEQGDPVALTECALSWAKAGNVLFYDARTEGHSITDFLEDHG